MVYNEGKLIMVRVGFKLLTNLSDERQKSKNEYVSELLV